MAAVSTFVTIYQAAIAVTATLAIGSTPTTNAPATDHMTTMYRTRTLIRYDHTQFVWNVDEDKIRSAPMPEEPESSSFQMDRILS